MSVAEVPVELVLVHELLQALSAREALARMRHCRVRHQRRPVWQEVLASEAAVVLLLGLLVGA